MKVLFLARSDLFTVQGGDTVQIENTAKELRKLGVEVDIGTNLKININEYDLVHIFQLDWVPETYFYVREAKKCNKPVVLSPIHHAEHEVKKFDDLYTFGLRKLVGSLVKKQEHRDILKNLYRAFYNRSKLIPTLKGMLFGYRKSQKEALMMSTVVLVQTRHEAEDLQNTYSTSFQWEKIVNGVAKQFIELEEYQNKLPFKDYIICVGRIEARKNQLKIIEAVKLLRREDEFKDLRLVFIGSKSNHHKQYVSKFEKEHKENSWISCPGYISQEDLPSYYHFAKVGVSASWFETTGLTSLEALFCGANVVASGNRAKELLGNYAVYCIPSDLTSITQSIKLAYTAPRPSIPQDYKSQFTWENTAEHTLQIYRKVLKGDYK